MEKEKFKSLTKDIKPLLDDISTVLQMHEVKNLVSIAVNAKGYFDFMLCGENGDACRISKKCPVIIKFTEELEMDYIPDNYDLLEQYEAELKRKQRLNKRLASAYDVEEREEKKNEVI